MPGAGIVNEPGGIAWEDARLGDVEAGRAFYTAVFGWSYGEIPGMELSEYGTFGSGGDPLGGLGGMMGAPEGTPSHWVVYFGTADIDTAVAAIERLGGGVMQPPMDTPVRSHGVRHRPVRRALRPAPGACRPDRLRRARRAAVGPVAAIEAGRMRRLRPRRRSVSRG